MSDSESSLSTPPASDDEMPVEMPPAKATKPAPQKKKKPKQNGSILTFLEKKAPSPPRKKRDPSPPHEPTLEDNFDIPFIVMFRSRFSDAFPAKCPHLGPQDIEQGVTQDIPSSQIESLLCALLGLVLNRKKPVEKGHYGRALEEAVQTQRSQWPASWNHINPLHGGRSFNTMTAPQRLELLKTLILWSLNQSEVVSAMIKEGYKSRSSKDKVDANIPLSVQPWGRDGDKRQYWLIEGQDDTAFRVYRESDRKKKNVTWWNVAGSIDELRVLANKLVEDDGTRDAKSLSERMLHAIPRFEATEEKRKRREYRNARKAAFTRPDPGFSLYEGRTRGKRMRYTFDDDEDGEVDSDAVSVRRSTRNSGRETSAVPAGPTVTASGRQVRSRATGAYGESLLSGQTTERVSPATGDYVRSEASEEPQGRPIRAAATKAGDGYPKKRKHIETYNSLDEMDDEDATSWDGGDEDEDEPDRMDVDDDENESDDASEDEVPKSLVVHLKYRKGTSKPSPPPDAAPEQQSNGSTGPAPVSPAPAQQLAPGPATAQPTEPTVNVSNGIPSPLHPTAFPAAPSMPLAADPQPLPKLDSRFGAPTPPYNSQEEAKSNPAPQYPVANPDTPYPVSDKEPAHRPFETTLPPPNPVSSWQ
ncbi:hypothetical protein CC80DRAFT_411196 [Byssothecium circinans]|uniref:WHIM1 domain-containing protein n=1 Tax=Byssothecium circinans TaxID=147558 RepID=A0A6A5U3L2_9PLEO|nr:hypothetical protein CC80DRAFT_411196 [Byssothecium circinans]